MGSEKSFLKGSEVIPAYVIVTNALLFGVVLSSDTEAERRAPGHSVRQF